MILFLGLFID